MGKFNPKKFVSPDTLKRVSFENLLLLLTQPGIREYLEGDGDGGGGPRMDLDADEPDFDYDRLTRVLLMPEDGYPDDLADALHHIAELADSEAVHLLQEEMGDDLDLTTLGDEPSPADIALHAWLKDRAAVEKVLGRQFLDKPKSFLAFLGPDPEGPELGDDVETEIRAKLEAHMRPWYLKNKGSDFVRVLPYERGTSWWFLVRHAMPPQRRGVIKDGKPTSTVERPEQHDIVVYTPENDELAVHASSKGEQKLYLEAFGLHLIPGGRAFTNTGKYTLEPLADKREEALSVAGIDGLDSVVLVQLQMTLGPGVVQTISAPDLMTFYAARDWKFPEKPNSATFDVKFTDVKRPRRLTIRKPNVAKYHREGDKDLIDLWMKEQGFIAGKAKG